MHAIHSCLLALNTKMNFVLMQLQEFRMKVGSVLPQIPKGNEGRTEFESLTDLMGYLAEQGKTSKQEPSKEPKDTSKA